jgi:hypothetical protein
MAVGANTTLSLVNLRLDQVAYKTAFSPSQAQRYRTDGIGTGLWPSIQFAPDSKVSTHTHTRLQLLQRLSPV